MTRRRKPEATRTTGETGEKVPRHLAFRPAEGGKGRTGGDQSTSPKEVHVKVPRVGSDLKRDAGACENQRGRRGSILSRNPLEANLCLTRGNLLQTLRVLQGKKRLSGTHVTAVGSTSHFVFIIMSKTNEQLRNGHFME